MSEIGGKGSEGAGRSTGICWVVTNPFHQCQEEPSDIRQMDVDLYEKICQKVLEEEIAKMAGKKESDGMEEERRKMDFLMSRQ